MDSGLRPRLLRGTDKPTMTDNIAVENRTGSGTVTGLVGECFLYSSAS